MRITVGDSCDLSVRLGASVRDIVDAARQNGLEFGDRAWCGPIALDPAHPVGTWPLLTGARISDTPAPPCSPPRGVVLAVLAGPDAGRWVPIGETGVIVGRGSGAQLELQDPSISRRHLAIRLADNGATLASDLGSANGTQRWRVAERRRIGRLKAITPGDVVALGRTLLGLIDPAATRDAGARPEVEGEPMAQKDTLARMSPLLASASMGAMVAVATGRWWFALIGLAYPAFAIAPTIASSIRARNTAPTLDALPCALPRSRRYWDEASEAIAVTGSATSARGAARAIILSRGRQPTPPWDEPWVSWLPAARPSDSELIVVEQGTPPSWAGIVVRATADGLTVERGGRSVTLPPVDVGEPAADAAARAMAGGDGNTPLSGRVRWADLTASGSKRGPAGTVSRVPPVAIGASATGTFHLDLDHHGPHMLIAGTTGSGKSALLETLILGLAHGASPSDLSLALIDFKGGAGLRACMALPHIVGVLTDLDGHLARRALAALAREISDRKGALAAAGHSSFHDWEAAGSAPPRLVVVADEYQELVAHHREFLPDLARLAAQGRSLGLHIILATQRPAGAVTPEIRANIGTTIALRVTSAAESRDLIGTDEACAFERDTPGRAIVASGTTREQIQVALSGVSPTPLVQLWSEAPWPDAAAELAEAITERWQGEPTPRRLWLDPLPHVLTDAPPKIEKGGERNTGVWLGTGDLPAERWQGEVTWEPNRGSLLVIGPPKSGRTSALRLVSSQAGSLGLRPVWLPTDLREAARTLTLAHRTPHTLLIVDDADRLLTALSDVDRGAPADLLQGMIAGSIPLAFSVSLTASPRLGSNVATRVLFASGDPMDDAPWSVPRHLTGAPVSPGRARVGTAGRWMETQIAHCTIAANEALVAQLPRHVEPVDLAETVPNKAVPIGIGGDDASIVTIDPHRPVFCTGAEGLELDRVTASLAASAQRAHSPLDVRVLSNPLAASRRELEASTIILTSPTFRGAREIYTGELDGLVDPRPHEGRVLVIASGHARAVQLAVPGEGAAHQQ